jgi:prepilin-type N-terminal cleavage/methylation domain-containing protein
MGRKIKAFTIVELLVVIVVIGVLASIIIVSYSGITERAKESTLQANLTNASRLMVMGVVDNEDVAPVSVPSEFRPTGGVGLSLSATQKTNSYCINGQIPLSGDSYKYMFFDSEIGRIQDGWCSGSAISGSEIGMNKNLTIDDSFTNIGSSGWNLSISGGLAGVVVSVREGNSGDPVMNKPVLTITNTTPKSPTWAYIYGQVYYSDIINSTSYKTSFYVRQINGFAENGGYLRGAAVMDGNALNVTIPHGDIIIPSSSWSLVKNIKTSLRAGTSLNRFYIYVYNQPFNAAGWTLELQLPQIVESV